MKLVELENGKCKTERTIMSETNLPADTEIEYIGHESRWTDTGYYQSLYKINGTDDLLIIYHNSDPIDNISFDIVDIEPDYFLRRREFAKDIDKISRKYKIPFDVCLALGLDESLYPEFIEKMDKFYLEDIVTIGMLRDLKAGINRRKNTMFIILGEDLYNNFHIRSKGKVYSSRIASYIYDKCMKCLNR